MLRLIALVIATLCIAPLALVLGSWLVPLSTETSESWQHLLQTLMASYLIETLWLCLGVSVVCGSLGVLTAWLTTQFSFRGRAWLAWGLILPLAVPAYISAYSYGWLLEYAGPVQTVLREYFLWSRGDYWFPEFRSLWGGVWVLGLSTTPYVYLLARTAFLSQPREWWEAAATLGAQPKKFFYKIALPAARPFIATGIALALMETIADIGTVTVLGIPTVSAGIYRSWFFMGEPLVAARLAGLLLVFIFILMGMESLGRRGMKYSSLRQKTPDERVPLSGVKNIAAFSLCLFPVLTGFLIPVSTLVRLSFYNTSEVLSSSVIEFLLHTLKLGLYAGLLAATAAFLMVCAERFYTSPGMKVISLLANLGYAIPGAVVAVGLMLFFAWLREYTQISVLITGSLWGLLTAYTVRFMATAYSPLHSGQLRIPEELDMAAASLRQNRFQIIYKIHLPLMNLPLFTAFIVVFLDTVKELPATLILRPFDVKTLAIAAFELASDDRHVEAAPFSLILITTSTIAVIVLHWIQNQSLRWGHGRN